MLTEFPAPSLDVVPHTLVVFLRTLPLPSTPISPRRFRYLKHAQGYTVRLCGHARELESQSAGNAFTTSWGPSRDSRWRGCWEEFSIWIDNLLKVTEVLLLVVVFTLQIHSRAWVRRPNMPSSPNSFLCLATPSLQRLMTQFLLLSLPFHGYLRLVTSDIPH
jgi:hypothetical protein